MNLNKYGCNVLLSNLMVALNYRFDFYSSPYDVFAITNLETNKTMIYHRSMGPSRSVQSFDLFPIIPSNQPRYGHWLHFSFEFFYKRRGKILVNFV
jgi:hypothetical protein